MPNGVLTEELAASPLWSYVWRIACLNHSKSAPDVISSAPLECGPQMNVTAQTIQKSVIEGESLPSVVMFYREIYLMPQCQLKVLNCSMS